MGTSFVSISYIECDGKLFYWDIDDSSLTQEVYDVLLKYDFIERRDVPSQEYLLGERGYFQDGVKHYQYYFCKSNPNDYKRRYSSVAKLLFLNHNLKINTMNPIRHYGEASVGMTRMIWMVTNTGTVNWLSVNVLYD